MRVWSRGPGCQVITEADLFCVCRFNSQHCLGAHSWHIQGQCCYSYILRSGLFSLWAQRLLCFSETYSGTCACWGLSVMFHSSGLTFFLFYHSGTFLTYFLTILNLILGFVFTLHLCFFAVSFIMAVHPNVLALKWNCSIYTCCWSFDLCLTFSLFHAPQK